jgi:hypothetical protein
MGDQHWLLTLDLLRPTTSPPPVAVAVVVPTGPAPGVHRPMQPAHAPLPESSRGNPTAARPAENINVMCGRDETMLAQQSAADISICNVV